MTYTFKIRDQIYKITLEKEDGQLQVEIEGRSIPVDFEKIEDDLYSVLIDGKSVSIGVFRKGKKVYRLIKTNEVDEYEQPASKSKARKK